MTSELMKTCSTLLVQIKTKKRYHYTLLEFNIDPNLKRCLPLLADFGLFVWSCKVWSILKFRGKSLEYNRDSDYCGKNLKTKPANPENPFHKCSGERKHFFVE